MSADAQKNLYEYKSSVTAGDRERILKQRGCVLWFTGLSGSGKSTLAHALERRLVQEGHAAFVLDGDNIRRRINLDLGFSDEDRSENIRRVAEVSALFADCGVICMAAFISPFRKDRDRARQIIGQGRMIEVFLSTSLQDCERRDPKGLYRRVRNGEVHEFTGISSPYENPESADITIDTAACSIEAAVDRLRAELSSRGFLRG